ncbi:MAG: PspC domain-containing protein [Chloroflexota bacterium]
MRRLCRSRRDRVILGVAGGLAEYFDIDVAIVRLIWVLLTFTAGPGTLLVYLIAGLVIPEQPRLPRVDTVDLPAGSPSTSDIDRELEELARASGSTTHSSVPVATHEPLRRDPRSNMILGLILAGFGALLLAHNLVNWFSIQRFWPLIIVVAGGLLIWRSLEHDGNAR